MNGRTSDERLSAWLDDELTLDERAEVERLLAESPELRQELTELAQVSALVKGLPGSGAPVELKASILRAIERDTLLAGTGPETGRSRRLFRILTVAAAVLAAGMVTWWGMTQRSETQVAETPPVRSFSSSPGISAANKPEPRKVAANAPAHQPGMDETTLNIPREQLDQVRIGDVIQAVEKNGDQVSVIRLTVVDRKAGAAALQVLLAREQISVNGSSDEGLVTVTVDSSSERLQRALQEMRQQVEFDLLSVGPPAEFAVQEPELNRIAEQSSTTKRPDGQKRVIFVLVTGSSEPRTDGSGAS